ncbi:MAG: hypothetical protein ACSHX3_11990 [Litorimonas sp.]
MKPPSNNDQPTDNTPSIRRPVLFYMTVTLAFGLLGAAVLALLL